MKESSMELLRLNEYIESFVMKKFENEERSFIDPIFRVMDKKLETGSLSLIVSFDIVLGDVTFKKNINFFMLYNDKLNQFSLIVTDGEHDGLKILYSYTAETIDAVIEASKIYLDTIVTKAIERVENKFFNYNMT